MLKPRLPALNKHAPVCRLLLCRLFAAPRRQTTLAQNDDDPRAVGATTSFLEWSCPSTGTVYAVVKGFGSFTGVLSRPATKTTGPIAISIHAGVPNSSPG